MKIQEALAAVMRDVQGVAKTDRNDHQKFMFRGIDAVLNAVGPALRKHQVIVLPELKLWSFDTVEIGQKRTPMGHAIVHMIYRFVGPEGDELLCSVPGEAMDSGDKAMAKAMSVAFRTALLQALALPTDEPDPDASTYERAPQINPEEDEELAELMKQAGDQVDREKVLGFAAQGPAQLEASKERLRTLLSEQAA